MTAKEQKKPNNHQQEQFENIRLAGNAIFTSPF